MSMGRCSLSPSKSIGAKIISAGIYQKRCCRTAQPTTTTEEKTTTKRSGFVPAATTARVAMPVRFVVHRYYKNHHPHLANTDAGSSLRRSACPQPVSLSPSVSPSKGLLGCRCGCCCKGCCWRLLLPLLLLLLHPCPKPNEVRLRTEHPCLKPTGL